MVSPFATTTDHNHNHVRRISFRFRRGCAENRVARRLGAIPPCRVALILARHVSRQRYTPRRRSQSVSQAALHQHSSARASGLALAVAAAAAYQCDAAARCDALPVQGAAGTNRERTFLAVKPDGVQRGLVGDIIARFEKRGYKVRRAPPWPRVVVECVFQSVLTTRLRGKRAARRLENGVAHRRNGGQPLQGFGEETLLSWVRSRVSLGPSRLRYMFGIITCSCCRVPHTQGCASSSLPAPSSAW